MARAAEALVTAVDAVEAARAAGLRYVDDRRPGLTRRATGRRVREGKRLVPEMVILDEHGKRVRDPATLERIRKLAIPPAWRDVWICRIAEGHIQATGRDARGRKQYRYHPRWRAERDATKYSLMIAFGQALPRLRRAVDADLRLPGLPRRKVLATVVRLLETTFIRVGNEEYVRANGSFGLTTLKDRHVRVAQGGVRFHFRGKSGIYHDVSVRDPSIARTVRRCRDLPGQELFQYLNADGQPEAIGSADVNAYIREVTGQPFTAKHFRTWAGTMLAARALREIATEAVREARAGAAKAKATQHRPTNREVIAAVKKVAERLGNTVSVCRKCYIHPDVISSYLDGTLVEAMAKVASVPAAPPPSARARTGARGLRPEEAAVLAFLRKRLAEERAERGRAERSRGEQSRGKPLATGETTLARQLRRSLRARAGWERRSAAEGSAIHL